MDDHIVVSDEEQEVLLSVTYNINFVLEVIFFVFGVRLVESNKGLRVSSG